MKNFPEFESMDLTKLQHLRDCHLNIAEVARMEQDHVKELWNVNMAKAHQRAIEERIEEVKNVFARL